MFLEADDALFRRILHNETHVLHTFLPERPLIVYSLHRPTKTHNKSLICKTSDLNERNFIDLVWAFLFDFAVSEQLRLTVWNVSTYF